MSTATDPLAHDAIAALQRLSEALWAHPAIDKGPILRELIHADTLLRRIVRSRVRAGVVAAMQQVNPYVSFTPLNPPDHDYTK